MPQAIKNMNRDQLGKSGSIWVQELTISANSDIYLVPSDQVYSIYAMVPVGSTFKYSFNSYATLNANTAVTWVSWNGTDVIPLGVTGWMIAYASGTGICEVVVKTAGIGN